MKKLLLSVVLVFALGLTYSCRDNKAQEATEAVEDAATEAVEATEAAH